MTLAPQTLSLLLTELASGHVRSRDLVEQALDAASTSSEAASTCLVVYAATARATADAIDAMRAAGVPLPVLAGLPITVKDLFDEAGHTTRAGSQVLTSAPPASQDSVVVQRLRAAGAVVVGRTNMTEFAYSGLGLNPHHGTPRNPWDRATGRIPGGSSSGAAVSVTDGMAAAAIGTDTGGSVRIPAALCGLTGFKPTARRVPTTGVLPLSPSLDSVGPLAHSVACCALLDAVMSGERTASPSVAPVSLAGRRFGIPTTLALDGLDATVSAAFSAACTAMSAAGAVLVDIEIPEFAHLAHINREGGLIAPEAWVWHAELFQSGEAHYDPRVAVRIRRGTTMAAAHYIGVQHERRRYIAGVQQRLAHADIATLLMPTVPAIAPPLAPLEASDALFAETNLLMLRNPTFINFLDGCAISVPCHREGDAPVGLMLAGVGGEDERVLRVGGVVETVLGRGR